MQKICYFIREFQQTRFATCTFFASALLCACATDDATRTSGRSSAALGYSGGGSGVAVATGGGGGYGGGSGVAVAVGNAGAYAGTGYGYVNNVGAVVAPVGGWYPFYYSSPLYASPVPQVYPMPQVQQAPYTYQPYYVQSVQPAPVMAPKP